MKDCLLTTIDDCRLIKSGSHGDGSVGMLNVMQPGDELPFEIRRLYYISRVPPGVRRGCHSHISLSQVIIPVSGSFEVLIDDGRCRRKIMMDRSDEGLLIVPGIWHELSSFSRDAVCLVAASDIYKEADYVRLYDDFIKSKSSFKAS